MNETQFTMTEANKLVYDALVEFHVQECPRCHCGLDIEEYVSLNDIRRFVAKELAEKIVKTERDV